MSLVIDLTDPKIRLCHVTCKTGRKKKEICVPQSECFDFEFREKYCLQIERAGKLIV